ncbi:MAG: hypothetical protein M0Z53_13865 [Thermaerobacter sp.]|nr:hypothetical protein [Thermaerobacter sp.]
MVRRPDPPLPPLGLAGGLIGFTRLFRILELGFEILFLGSLAAVGVGLLTFAPPLAPLARFLMQAAMAFAMMRRRWAWGAVTYAVSILCVATYPPWGSLDARYLGATGAVGVFMVLSQIWPVRPRLRWFGMILAVWADRAIDTWVLSPHPLRAWMADTARVVETFTHWFGVPAGLTEPFSWLAVSALDAALWGSLLFLLISQLAWYYGIDMPSHAHFGHWHSPRGLSVLFAAGLAAGLVPIGPAGRYIDVGVVWGAAYYLIYGANVAWAFLQRFAAGVQVVLVVLLLVAGPGAVVFLIGFGMLDEWWVFRNRRDSRRGRTE